jgi:uncharacterized protein YecE (DUF72 family)
MAQSIRLGTCGWPYKDWSGVFYPQGLHAGDWLSYYAEHYHAAEVDSTFYRTSGRKMVEGWQDKAPDGFGFSLKVPQTIIHEKLLLKCPAGVERVLTAAQLLGEKWACCCLQFPHFNKKAFASLDALLERLDPFLVDWPTDVPVAVEIRNKNWLMAQFANCFRSHKAAWVLSDQAWMLSPLYVVQ